MGKCLTLGIFLMLFSALAQGGGWSGGRPPLKNCVNAVLKKGDDSVSVKITNDGLPTSRMCLWIGVKAMVLQKGSVVVAEGSAPHLRIGQSLEFSGKCLIVQEKPDCSDAKLEYTVGPIR